MPLVTVVGSGRVGSEVAEMILLRDLADVVLIDIVEGLAKGEALDLAHMASILGVNRDVRGSREYRDMEGSDIVVIVAGVPRKPGMTREELISVNAGIVKQVSEAIREYAPRSRVIVVTNPMDAMVYVAWRVTGFSRERVIGFGPSLDSARLRDVLSRRLGKPRTSIEALVLGQHGEAMVPIFSHTRVEGKPVKEILSPEELKQVAEEVRKAGAEIIRLRGFSSHHAPGAGVAELVETMIRNSPRLIPTTVVLQGEYGCRGIPLAVPTIVSGVGVERVLEIDLDREEREGMRRAAEKILELLKALPEDIRPRDGEYSIGL